MEQRRDTLVEQESQGRDDHAREQIEGQKVRRYERYILGFSFKEEKSPLKYDYLEIWNNQRADALRLVKPPYLIYRIRDGYLSLQWVIERAEGTLYRTAY